MDQTHPGLMRTNCGASKSSMTPSPLTPPTLRDDLPRYPPLMQALRVTGGTVPGPSGYASSSVIGPSLYVAFVQQLHPTTLLPRDREPCFALDLNRYGLTPGYYTNCRLAGSYQSLPIYEVGGSAVSPISSLSQFTGLTQTQVQELSTLSPSQIAILNNLNPCQLQVLLDAVPISQIQTLTSGVLTATQLTEIINYLTPSQFTQLYTQLTTSQIITLTSTLNFSQVETLTQTLTPTQIQTLVTTLTSTQLQTLAGMTSQQIDTLVTNLTTLQIQTFLNIVPLPPCPPAPPPNLQIGTTYTFQPSDEEKLVVFNNSSPIAGTLPDPTTVGPGWYTEIWNRGTGTLTLTPTSGTINGAATFTVSGSTGTRVYSDGTNYQVSSGGAGVTSSGSTRTEGTLAATGSTQGTAAQIVTDAVEVTGADNTKGVILPNTTAGIIIVWNNHPTGLLFIYPPSGAQLANQGTNTGVLFAATTITPFVRISSTQWSYSASFLSGP